MAVKSKIFLLCLFSVLLMLVVCDEASSESTVIQSFLATARAEEIINEQQFVSLLQLSERLATPLNKAAVTEPNVLWRVVSHFTLRNVVYFSGALLIIGAYTLFMTLAFEKFHHGGLSVIVAVQMVLFGGTGLVLWGSDELQLVGGLFCTISTSTVPFLMYNVQQALGMWPGRNPPGAFQEFNLWIRPSWVVMEIATVVTGLVFLVYVRFPFLLFPVSFYLWFLSMDLAPLYPGFEQLGGQKAFEIRRRVSLAFGIGMIISGYVFETVLGSEPDMGFWLYLFGTFLFSMTLNFNFPQNDFNGSLFLLVQIALILLGSHLNRTTLHVFGTLGVIGYVGGLYSGYVKMSLSFALWALKLIAAAALFSQALRRDGSLEILGGLVCALAFNFNYIGFAGSGELYSVFLLLGNLGLVSTAAAFTQPLSLWLFTLPTAGTVLSIVCSLLVAIFHLQLPIRYISSPPFSLTAYLYNAYRLLASILISFVFVYLHQPHFAWVGGLGIPLIAVNFSPVLRNLVARGHTSSQALRFHTGIKSVLFSGVTFSLLLFGVAFSIYLKSNLLYLICCVFLFVSVMCLLSEWKILGCVFSVLLMFASVPLQSSFLITIGVVYIFSYLSYLAYDYFKNSLLFPLALIVLGLSVIYSGIQYQKYEQLLHQTLFSFLPQFLVVLISQNFEANSMDMSNNLFSRIQQTRFSIDSFLSAPQNWILWPGALTFALRDGPLPYVTVGCVVMIALLALAAVVMSYRMSMVKNLDDSIKVSDIKFSLSRDPAHENHGLVIEVKGYKPSVLSEPVHLSLNVEGSDFWGVASRAFGEFPVNLARSVILPYKLTPHLISLTGFQNGGVNFSAKILLGTGHMGSKRMKHTTAESALRKLTAINEHVEVACVVLYSNSWYHPWSKLCVKSVQLRDVLRQLSPSEVSGEHQRQPPPSADNGHTDRRAMTAKQSGATKKKKRRVIEYSKESYI